MRIKSIRNRPAKYDRHRMTPGNHQQNQRDDRGPEHILLPDVALVDRGQIVVAVLDYIGQSLAPFAVIRLDLVVVPVAHRHHNEQHKHQHPQERVQDARPGATAEQRGQEPDAAWKNARPDAARQNEQDRDSPVIQPLVLNRSAEFPRLLITTAIQTPLSWRVPVRVPNLPTRRLPSDRA